MFFADPVMVHLYEQRYIYLVTGYRITPKITSVQPEPFHKATPMTRTESGIDAQTNTQPLAIDGGPKAIGAFQGVAQPKIGVEDFMALAKRFGFNDDAMKRIEAAISNDDMPQGGPVLSRYWSSKPKPAAGEVYEANAREFFGAKFAMATSSGTGALHAAMVAVGAKPGKEVIVASTGFIATALAVGLAGATPVFCDVDDSFQMDPTKIEACITPNTIAIAPTHHWSGVADMDPILAIAKKHGLKVVEDCAQSPGAQYKGKYVGTIGDIGCFSISGYKIIGAGEGGMILSNDQKLFHRATQLAEAGGLCRPNRFAPPVHEGELFIGTNYRASDLESAVNVVQLKKLPGIVSRHRNNFHRIAKQLLRTREITPAKLNDPNGAICYASRFIPNTEALRVKLLEALRAEGLGVGSRGPKNDKNADWHLSSEMYPLKDVLGPNSNADKCPVADRIFRSELSMSIDQWWNEDDCDMVAAAMNKVFAACCTPDDNGAKWL